MTVRCSGGHEVRALKYAVNFLYLTAPHLCMQPTVHQKHSKATLCLVARDAAQLGECLLSGHKALPACHSQHCRKWSVVVHASDPSIWEVEVGGSGVWGHPQL